MNGAFSIPSDLGDRLLPVDEPVPDAGSLRSAAVLALLFEQPQPRLLLIERSKALRNHAGQLAFPGGKREPDDVTLLDTALRESEEEVALPRDVVRVVGRLPTIGTPTGFQITPFVALATQPFQPRPACGEVSRVLMPTLEAIANPAIHRVMGVRTQQGQRYELHEYRIAEPPLWGATAFMVHDLLARMTAEASRD